MILIGLGANLPGFRASAKENVLAAMNEIEAQGVRVLRCSSVWRSAPVPASDQPWYYNAVIAVETEMCAQALMKFLQGIEVGFGRQRQAGVRNESRILDLDLLAYGDEVYTEEVLRVPHPRMHQRGFVLYPLYEIAPEWVHPVLRRGVAQLIADLPAGQSVSRAA